MHQHPIAIEGVHRIALSHKDGLTIIVGSVHRVFAIAATNENAFFHRGAHHRFKAARRNLCHEAIHMQLLQQFHHHSTLAWRGGTHLLRHLLVVVGDIVGGVKEINHLVVEVTTFDFIGF